MLNKPRVVYVDDCENNRIVFQHAFASKFIVETCPSAKAALAIVERSPPEAVVTDYRMPEMNGLRLLERVREISPETRRLLVTAFNDEEPKMHLDGCVQGYFQKPFSREEIETALEPTSLAQVEGTAQRVLSDLERVLAEDEARYQAWLDRSKQGGAAKVATGHVG